MVAGGDLFQLVVLVLAAFRITHLLVFDEIAKFLRDPFIAVKTETLQDGTQSLVAEPRGTGLRRFVGRVLVCYWCAGIWVSGFLVAGLFLFPVPVFRAFVLLMAIAGGQALLGKWEESKSRA